MSIDDTVAEKRLAGRGDAGNLKVEVRSVHLSFGGQKVLDGLSFDLRVGELAVLCGENGTGKTVLMNLLSGYLCPDQGSIRLRLGETWVDATRARPERLARHGVGRLWQDIRLFSSLTVLDNVLAAGSGAYGSLLWVFARHGTRTHERRERLRALENLALVGMADRAHSSCDMLSVGQMKRVALARLLQLDASLLLLDEPFAGLDATAIASFARDLEGLRTKQGKTILAVEHRHEALSRIADRAWTIRGGRVHESEQAHV